MADVANRAVDFSYETAFSRNLGWVTEWEQQALRHKRVAIAGMGGVGGSHLLTLARLGIGAFNIADLDKFELVNFNRQAGATLDTVGKPKVEVLAERALQINPELRINIFDCGVDDDNLDEFLAGVDLFVDALDFFVLNIRRRTSKRCAELGIPVINAAPLGMGTAYLIFQPGGMTFEEWFRLEGFVEEEQYVRYLVGIAPSALHRTYLVDPTRVDLAGHRGPSTVAACELCAGVAGVEAVKLLLRRGRVRAAPYYHQFDAYRGRWVSKRLRGGNAHPLQRLKIALTRRLAVRLSQQAQPPVADATPLTELEKILDLARWAPSGDNIQPWRFEIVGDDCVVVYLTDEVGNNLYDYRDGEPTLLSGGGLLEAMRIAATGWGRRCDWHYEGQQGRTHRIVVSLPKAIGVDVDPHISCIPSRSVDRRPYKLRRLTEAEKSALTGALGPDLEIRWHETPGQRWRLARLSAKATAIRLTTYEAFNTHQRILDWDNRFSSFGIPAGAAGIGRMTLPVMRWAMRSWPRMRFLNWFGGTSLAVLQLDYIPAVWSGALFTLGLTQFTGSNDIRAIRLLEAGQRIQRFWLTATQLGLGVQPNLAPICFAEYGRTGVAFTAKARTLRKAGQFADKIDQQVGGTDRSLIFLGRVGAAISRRSVMRSVRYGLKQLMMPETATEPPKG